MGKFEEYNLFLTVFGRLKSVRIQFRFDDGRSDGRHS